MNYKKIYSKKEIDTLEKSLKVIQTIQILLESILSTKFYIR